MAYRAKERLFLTADRERVVAGDDPAAAFLLVPAGGEIPDEVANKYGLKRRKQPPPNKERPAEEDKAVHVPPPKRRMRSRKRR